MRVPGTASAKARIQPDAAGNGLSPFATVTGKVYMSNDAIGTNDSAGGVVRVRKADASASVRAAYLLAATTPDNTIADGDVTLDATPISFPSANTANGTQNITSYWTDVTSIVKPVVDAAAAGNISLTAAEPNNPGAIDGEVLAVIMNDPTLPTNNTVALEFGALASAGDTYSIGLASPLNLSDPNLSLTMSIGDSYGYQGPPATGQYSNISVNGTLMTSSAGGNDDAATKYDATPDYASAGNGELITVGGIGDSTANPPDPSATDSECAGGPPRCDDELYNLRPFVNNGDTSITVNTDNPSFDDNIFYTGFELDSTAAVVGEGAILTPVSGTSPVGTPYTLTGKLQDDDGNPIANRAVKFTVLSGPNTGAVSNTTTDNSGKATFTYTSATAGTDDVVLSFTGSDATTLTSNDATVRWTATSTNNAPVAKDATVTTPQNVAVSTPLTATDADGDTLTYTVVDAPTHGTLSGAAPALTYTPATGYIGPDSFTWKANDGKADSNVATESITVTPPSTGCVTTAPTLDGSASGNQRTAASQIVAHGMSTAHAGDLVLAFVEADGPTAPTQEITSVRGAGLKWTLATRSNATWGTTEVWQAYATHKLTSNKITATLLKPNFDGAITVAAFAGTRGKVGAVASASGITGTPAATVTPKGCNSLIWAAGHDWLYNTPAVPVAGQSLVHRFIDTRVHDTFWTQKVDAPTSKPSVTVADTSPTKDRWTLAAVEIAGK